MDERVLKNVVRTLTARFGRELDPKPGRELRDAVPPLGRAQDPPERGTPLGFEVGRGHPIGRNHEVLDQLLGPVLPIQFEARDGIALEDRPRLQRLKAQGTQSVSRFREPLSDTVLEPEIFIKALNLLDALTGQKYLDVFAGGRLPTRSGCVPQRSAMTPLFFAPGSWRSPVGGDSLSSYTLAEPPPV